MALRAGGRVGDAGYIRRRRLESARRDLAAPGRLPVADIAASRQFADSSHFVRAFKRRYGETPAPVRAIVGRPGSSDPAQKLTPGPVN